MASDSIKQLIHAARLGHAARLVGDRSKRRYLAAVIDQPVGWGCFYGGAAALRELNTTLRLNFSGLTLGLLAYSSYLIYFALTEWWFSATLGKLFFSLRVRSLTLQPCTLGQALIRTATRIIEVNPILLGGLPAMLLIKISHRGQRLGEMLSGTLVVSREQCA